MRTERVSALRRQMRPIGAVVGLCLLALGFQGSRGLWEPDEGRYAIIAVNMVRHGDWMHPRLSRDRPHLTKPPLTYWAIASSLAVLGRNEWAVRLPNAAAFALTVVLVYGLGRRLAPREAWLPALVYATSVCPYAAANIVTPDTVLTLWETLAVYGFVSLWWGDGARRRQAWRVVMWAGFGLAFVTKGPPGLLPLLAIVLFAFVTKRWAGLRGLISVPGVAAFALIGLTWYAFAVTQHPGLARYYLIEEVAGRLVGHERRHSEWYWAFILYVPAFLVGAMPWTGVMLRGILRGIRFLGRLRRVGAWHESERDAFLALWFLLPLGVFSLAPSRMLLYVLPLFVPLALLLARRLAEKRGHSPFRPPGAPKAAVQKRRMSPFLRTALVAVWVVLLLGAKWAASAYPVPRKDGRLLAKAIRSQVPFAPAEVIFVGRTPCYSLGLYLDAEVKRVELRASGNKPASPQKRKGLFQELSEGRGPMLFVVRDDKVAEFRELSDSGGWRAEALGGHGDLRFFRLISPGRGLACQQRRPLQAPSSRASGCG